VATRASHGPGGAARGDSLRVVFRDPRRFGGLWALPDPQTLRARWNQLGPDGLNASPAHIAAAIGSAKRRAAKAALLDQAVIAGVGNIYADEALHRAGVHPEHPIGSLTGTQITLLVDAIQSILRAAVASGGSSLRDYVDTDNRPGQFQTLHQVYGRAGLPCRVCATVLSGGSIAGRTTVFCQQCQPLVHISESGRALRR
jgi:formamidopyrimidine-DNA glycosylase